MKSRGNIARITKLLFYSLIFLASFFIFAKNASASTDHLVINEICPFSTCEDGEWIELYNPTAQSIDLSSYTIEDNNHNPKKLSGIINNDSHFVIIFTGLNDDGDTQILMNDNQVIDKVSYGKYDDGNISDNAQVPFRGKSIARYPNGMDTNNDSIDFAVMAPTKNSENVKPSYLNDLLITEIVPEPENGAANEFIEVFNNGQEDIDLYDWSLKDQKGSTEQYVIQDHTIIKSGQYIAYYNSTTKISLNDDGDGVSLLDPNNDEKYSTDYSESERGESYSKFDNSWQWTESLTPGNVNVFTETLAVNSAPVNENAISIAEARKLANGEDVVVTGVISVLPGTLSSQYFYIEDEVIGIQIYCYSKSFPELSLGGVVKVSGTLSEVSGERRIKIESADNIFILSHTSPPEPVKTEIKDINENIEGKYIKVSGKVVMTSGQIFTIEASSYQIVINIRTSTKTKKPKMSKGDIVEIAGIVSQYKSYYRILPTKQNDVRIISHKSGLPETGARVSMYPVVYLIFNIIWIIFLKAKKKRIGLLVWQ